MSDPKFWSDDFDMDLTKVIPDAKHLLGDCADLELVTHGHTTHGRLNHPCVWNHTIGTVAFFGRTITGKPSQFYTNDTLVSCTLWEAIRDSWAHHFILVFEGDSVIWDGAKALQEFDPLMSHTRKWICLPEWRVAKLRQTVRLRLELVPYLLEKAIAERTPA